MPIVVSTSRTWIRLPPRLVITRWKSDTRTMSPSAWLASSITRLRLRVRRTIGVNPRLSAIACARYSAHASHGLSGVDPDLKSTLP
jgi:hypothetical protein